MPAKIRKTGKFFDDRFDCESLFRDLTAKALESFASIKYTARFQKGESIFAAGELPQYLYVIRKGSARLLIKSESNDGQTIRSVEPNEILGLTETVANLRFETSAEAISSCEVELVNREDFMRFLREEGEVCFKLVNLLALNLQKSYKALCLQSFKTSFLTD